MHACLPQFEIHLFLLFIRAPTHITMYHMYNIYKSIVEHSNAFFLLHKFCCCCFVSLSLYNIFRAHILHVVFFLYLYFFSFHMHISTWRTAHNVDHLNSTNVIVFTWLNWCGGVCLSVCVCLTWWWYHLSNRNYSK